MASGCDFTGGGGMLQLYLVKSLLIPLMWKNYYSSYLELSIFYSNIDTNSRGLILNPSICEVLIENIPMSKT